VSNRFTLSPTGRVVILWVVAALLVLVPWVPPVLRIPVAAGFFVVGPGLSWVFALPVEGPIERGGAAVALSLTLGVLVAEALLFVGLTGALPAAAVLAAIAVTGGVVEARRLAAASPMAEVAD
jgi:hypothetical protein